MKICEKSLKMKSFVKCFKLEEMTFPNDKDFLQQVRKYKFLKLKKLNNSKNLPELLYLIFLYIGIYKWRNVEICLKL